MLDWAGRTYILGYRLHLACVEGDIPLGFTVQPLSRNDKLFYKPLLEDASKTGVCFRVVAADRQYDSTILRQWTWKTFKAKTAIPTRHKHIFRKLSKVMPKSGLLGRKGLLGLLTNDYVRACF
ncbi:MAG: hypothetical protein QW222_03765 [Candidatus Bathyarchaeia archaeon]